MNSASPGQVTLLQINERALNLARGMGTETFKPIWPAVAQMCVSDVKRNFNESHSPDGTPWIPLAHGRASGKGRDKPLQDLGILYASITGKADANGATVGTNVEYANIHQFGGVIVPRRAKFLAIPLTVEAKRAESPRNFPGNPRWRFVPTRTGGWVMLAARPLSRAQADGIAARRSQGKRLTAKQQRLIAAVAQYVLVKRVQVPARPFLGFSVGLINRISQLILDTAADVVMSELMAEQRRAVITQNQIG